VAVLARLGSRRAGREHGGLAGRAELRRGAVAIARSHAPRASARPAREALVRRCPDRPCIGAAIAAPEPRGRARTAGSCAREGYRAASRAAPAYEADEGCDRAPTRRQAAPIPDQAAASPGRRVNRQSVGSGGGGGSASSCGNRTSIVVPIPVSSTWTLPPCDSTIAATIASPSPAPPVDRARAGSPR
jgi:hypothetical protein